MDMVEQEVPAGRLTVLQDGQRLSFYDHSTIPSPKTVGELKQALLGALAGYPDDTPLG